MLVLFFLENCEPTPVLLLHSEETRFLDLRSTAVLCRVQLHDIHAMVLGIGRNRLGSDLTSVIDALGARHDESIVRSRYA